MTIEEVRQWMMDHRQEKLVKSLQKSYPHHQVIGLTMGDLRTLAEHIGSDDSLAQACLATDVYEFQMLGALITPIQQTPIQELEGYLIRAQSTYIIDQGWTDAVLAVDDIHMHLEKWMTHDNPHLRYAGYALFSAYCRLSPLETLSFKTVEAALQRIVDTIRHEPLVIQNAMNNCVVMAGLHVPGVFHDAQQVAEKIGYILPLKAKNSCNIQSASEYLVRYIDQPRFSRVARLQSKK